MPLPPPLDRLFRAGAGAEREEAWGAFVEEYSRLLMSVTRSVARDVDGRMDGYTYLLDRLQADDFARLRSYAVDGRARFSTWLVVVAQRLCIDFHRSRYGRAREAQDPAERAARRQLRDLVGDVIDIEALPGRTSSPDLGVRRAELTAALATALGHLDPSDRLLLTLRFTDDLPASRIAQVMSYPTQFHVYRRLNRILARLKEELQDRGVQDPAP